MKTNSAFARYLDKPLLANLKRGRIRLAKGLDEILSAGFLAANGSVFLKRLYVQCKGARRADFPDDTGFECFVNHLHIDDYANAARGPKTRVWLEQALTFAFALSEELNLRKLLGTCAIIVSISPRNGCTVRFHRQRAGESWLSEPLEDFQDEGVMVLTTEVRAKVPLLERIGHVLEAGASLAVEQTESADVVVTG